MIGVEQGVAQVIILIGELNGGLVEHDALLHAVALGEGAGGDIADDDLQRYDGDLLHGSLPVGQLFHIVGGYALCLQPAHEIVGHAVIDGALAGDGTLLEAIEGGGIVLIGDDDHFGVAGGEHFLCLSLVELLLLLVSHLKTPPSACFDLFGKLHRPSGP